MTPLQTLEQWVRSDDFAALVGAYRLHHETGTTGTGFSGQSKPAVINERGVLRPERFEQYMLELQSAVIGAINTSQPLQVTDGVRLLQSTLEQMIGSVSFGDTDSGCKLKGLFEKGKEMGNLLRKDFNAAYQYSTGRRAGY